MRLSYVLSLVLLVAGAASAAESSYQRERAECMQRTNEDQKACLREAGAARQAERRHQLEDEDASQAQYEKNRLQRCAYLPEADRPDCERRMRGEGTVSGSVESGGIYRELRTIVPAEEGPASAGSSSTDTRRAR